IFELFGAPDIGHARGIRSGLGAVAGNRCVDVEQRPIGVENEDGRHGLLRAGPLWWVHAESMGPFDMPDNSPVAIVGLGLMGEVYAKRLIDAHIPVIGYDIDAGKRSRLALVGGRPVNAIADLAKPARCIIIAVFNMDQVEDVLENHLLPALGDGSGKIVLCMSTVDPDRVAALASRVIPRGIRYLDVPVSGTSDQVRRGDGVALIGGDKAIADEVAPIFDALFARRFIVGKIGD